MTVTEPVCLRALQLYLFLGHNPPYFRELFVSFKVRCLCMRSEYGFDYRSGMWSVNCCTSQPTNPIRGKLSPKAEFWIWNGHVYRIPHEYEYANHGATWSTCVHVRAMMTSCTSSEQSRKWWNLPCGQGVKWWSVVIIFVHKKTDLEMKLIGGKYCKDVANSEKHAKVNQLCNSVCGEGASNCWPSFHDRSMLMHVSFSGYMLSYQY